MTSLLPPNATPFERALEAVTARIGDISAPIDTLLDPQRISGEWLPWLAWALSVDMWDSAWPDAVKRDAVAQSIALHRIKGTRQSVAAVLARFDELARIIEWHEATPRAQPHTFEIHLPVAGGAHATAAFADAIVREVSRVKPLREHFTLLQGFSAAVGIGVQAVARPTVARRDDLLLTDDRSQPWDAFLQNEDGEPLQADDGGFLDTTP